jgi:nucleotide-binding universal stress UspA family protein
MRILFATDGSLAADHARDLLAGLTLPAHSEITVVGVRRHHAPSFGAGWTLASGEAAAQAMAQSDSLARAGVATAVEQNDRIAIALDTAIGVLESLGHVERVLLDGRPASCIVDEARDWKADLVVVGSRGHGMIESMLLGSVSREVVNHAPCAVLVARGPRLRHVLLAADGSPDARRAEDALATWPIFAGLPVRVLSVAQVDIPMAMGGAAMLYDQVMAEYATTVDEARSEERAFAQAAADRLTEAGHPTTWEERDGEPATEIVREATDRNVDLVVVGTRGHTGLARLLLGSVAESVAIHAPCSVLVVRAGPAH